MFASIEFLDQTRKLDIAGMFLLSYTAATFSCGPLIPIVQSFLGVDPFFPLVDNFILPHPYQRSAQQVVTSRLSCLLLSIVGFMELLRCAGVILCFVIIFFLSIQAHLRVLVENPWRFSEEQILQSYRQVLLLFARCKDAMYQSTLAIMACTQIILVYLAWVAVNLCQVQPVLITISAGVACVVGTIIITFILRLSVYTKMQCVKIIESKRNLLHGYKCFARGRYYFLRWKAQMPIVVYCGTMFSLSTEAVMSYLSVLNTNMTNAILLIQV